MTHNVLDGMQVMVSRSLFRNKAREETYSVECRNELQADFFLPPSIILKIGKE